MGYLRPGYCALWFALASAATFGVSGTFAKSLLESGWSPGAAVTLRISGAALVLLGPALWSLRGRWQVLRGSAGVIAAYGAVAIALCQFFYFNAVARLDIAVALLIEYSAPVLIVGWLWLRNRRIPQRLTVVGSLAAMGGLLLVLDLAGTSRLDPIGVLWAMAAAVCLVVFFLLSARVQDDLPPMAMAGGGMVVGSLVMLVLGAVGVMPFRFSTADVHLGAWQTSWLVPLLGLILVSTAIAYVLGIVAARRLGSKIASFVALTEVMFAVLAAWLVLGEVPGPVQLLGGVLIVAGVSLVRLDELRTGDPESVPANPVEPVPGNVGR